MVIRASDRQAALDSELKSLQVCLRELESFLKWLHEAETTANVLSDAAQREELSQDSAHIKELKGQLGVRTCTYFYSIISTWDESQLCCLFWHPRSCVKPTNQI